MRHCLALLIFIFSQQALAIEVELPQFKGKVIESISMLTDFNLNPGQWSNCAEGAFIANEDFEFLKLYSCEVENARMEIKFDNRTTALTFNKGSVIQFDESTYSEEYILGGGELNGLPVVVVLLYSPINVEWTGFVRIGDYAKHHFIIE